MIGKTNSQTGGAVKGEKLNISLTSNQSDKSDLLGAIITVAHPGGSTEYAWEGYEITVDIPPYVEYTVSFSEVEGYKTPESFTSTAVSGNSRTLAPEYLAEKVSVTLVADDSESVSGQTVTINGKAHTYGGSAVEQLVPFDTDYTISVDSKEFYVTPSQVSRKAQAQGYPVTLTYKASKLTVSLTSNQSNDTVIAATKATVSWTGTSLGVGNGETIRIPADKTVTVTYPSVTGYATPSRVTVNNTNGGTATASGQYRCSVVTVRITDNQTSYNDIASATATVTGGASATLSNGGTVKVPWNSMITVTGSAVSGYNTPSATFSASVVTGIVTLTYATEILTVTVGTDGTMPSDYTVTVVNSDTGTTIGLQMTSSQTYKIPAGTKYYVKASSVSGFTAPANSSTYTASSSSNASRQVTMTYEEIKGETLTVNVNASNGASVDGQIVSVSYNNGVYIQDTEGNLWTESGWDGSKTPNGIAVITDNCQFVMALNDISTGMQIYNSYSIYPDLPQVSSSSSAILDYDGVGNTAKMTAVYGTDATYAAGACTNFTFPNGKKGYLGAAGEWQAAVDNKAAINTALSKVGGTQLPTSSYHWSSTRASNDSDGWCCFWRYGWYDSNWNDRNVGYNTRVRAFAPLEANQTATQKATVTNGKATFTIPQGVTYSVSVNAKDGYITPASQTYTAASGSRTISMTYTYHGGTTNPTNGIYIQDTDGFFHTESEWTGTYTPNGVAVITNNCRFVMALANAYSSSCQWGGYGTTVSGIVTSTSESTAAADYKGETNTTTIINALKGTNDGYVDGAPAAEYCRAYTFPNGAVGYMGAAGEWQAALDNKAAIVSALSKCGGTAMSSYYWTSTQYSSGYSWYVFWVYEYLTDASKGNGTYVRAFAAI